MQERRALDGVLAPFRGVAAGPGVRQDVPATGGRHDRMSPRDGRVDGRSSTSLRPASSSISPVAAVFRQCDGAARSDRIGSLGPPARPLRSIRPVLTSDPRVRDSMYPRSSTMRRRSMSQVETPVAPTSPVKTPVATRVVAVYPDHASAEEAVKAPGQGRVRDAETCPSWAGTSRWWRSRSASSARATSPRSGRRRGHGSAGCSACCSVRRSWSCRASGP